MEFDFSEIIECGRLFEERMMDKYYELYKGEISRTTVRALDFICARYAKGELTTAKMVGMQLDIPKQHASQVMMRLEECGYVKTVPCETDKRMIYLEPTELGHAVISEHLQKSVDNLADRLQKLSREEQIVFQKSFSDLLKILEKL